MGLHLLEDELHGGVSEDGLDLWVVEGCLSSSFRVVLSHTPLQTSPGILWWQEERERERETGTTREEWEEEWGTREDWVKVETEAEDVLIPATQSSISFLYG